MSNTSKNESKSFENKNTSSSEPQPTDEVRPDIRAAAKPIETANFSKGEIYKTMEIRNDSASSD